MTGRRKMQAAVVAATVTAATLLTPASSELRVLPNVQFLPRAEIQRDFCLSVPCGAATVVGATYSPLTQTIRLDHLWSPGNVYDLSILLHEFVHHLQTLGDLPHRCANAREQAAYSVQNVFLEAYGAKPAANELTVMTRAACREDD